MLDAATAPPKLKGPRVIIAVALVVVVAVLIAWQLSKPSLLDQVPRSSAEDTKLAKSPAIEGGPPPLTGSSGVEVIDLLKQANALRAEQRFREAEILLTKAVQIDGDDIRVWRALAAVQRDMSAASLRDGNLLSAAQEGDRARGSVNGLKGVCIDPKSPSIDPKILIDEEEANTAAIKSVRDAIDLECQRLISNADKCANDAFRSSWNGLALGLRDVKNDRGKVVEGLKHLKNVFELGAWASEAIRMSANEAYSKLKKLVYPEEWNDLLARAGFDPGSRDTLKKWGLE